MEKYDILYLDRWHLESIEESLALRISHEYEISWNEEFFELHLARYLSQLESNTPKKYRRMEYTSNLDTQRPLPKKPTEGEIWLIVEEYPTAANDEYIRTSNESNIVEKISNITKKVMTNIIGKIRYISNVWICYKCTRTIIGRNSDFYIFSVFFFDILYLSLEDQFISQIVRSDGCHE
jgi:hypothetical protein